MYSLTFVQRRVKSAENRGHLPHLLLSTCHVVIYNCRRGCERGIDIAKPWRVKVSLGTIVELVRGFIKFYSFASLAVKAFRVDSLLLSQTVHKRLLKTTTPLENSHIFSRYFNIFNLHLVIVRNQNLVCFWILHRCNQDLRVEFLHIPPRDDELISSIINTILNITLPRKNLFKCIFRPICFDKPHITCDCRACVNINVFL
mmetsp:Transcript_2579/g.5223  ORF Transcript_2579/g.5223 Transcript_2579/m.5223 type:complete len:201 (+) Transcript_2579:1791-2393(+)